ncbi:glycosyltransferase family 4 protein [Clostridium sp. AWRP]|uniref:glycosyltransferase family 4 protein n=1 Tax=Clostridium sp. AWRP TaxID=2212991 RepID=UPI000FD9E9F1|nr:glycosyltransferase family 4 protein [Clostridium sp. AWRP]AZV55534.1 glycosyltransferase [Clostridium sp. AWRP]
MKVLWIGNIILPQIAEYEGIKEPVVGGWMVYLADLVSSIPETNLVYLFDDVKSRCGVVNKITYYAVENKNERVGRRDEEYIQQLIEIIQREKPDVIHIWGTEDEHALAMVEACSRLKIINRVVISIQGLLSEYAKYYYAYLPERVIHGTRIKDLIKGNLKEKHDVFEKKGKYEIEAISSVKHVIGRTDWDKACVWAINPDVHYHFNNEILRKEFYMGQWEYLKCEKHSIFCSQAHYPIKGIHLMLQAMPIIKREYPDVKLYIGGKDFSQDPKWKLSVYQKYILDIIKKEDLTNNVFFTGFLNAEKMKQQYLHSNVFVSPSSIENSPNSVGEAMLLGVPVVSSCVGGVQNMIEHGREGLLYPANDIHMLAYYVCKVFDDESFAINLSKEAVEHATKTHDQETNLKQLISIYNDIERKI